MTEIDLDAIETRAAHLYEYATTTVAQVQDDFDQLSGTDVPALVAEVRRLRGGLATAQKQAIDWATDQVDAKLTVELDHNRASALYELLLHLRDELPCTCARAWGLHAKDCRKYVPGHELISRHNQLARYRAERAARSADV